MNKHIDELSEGVDASFDTGKALVKSLIIAFNNEITKILVQSIKKSQEIESLKDKIESLKNKLTESR